MANEHNAKNNAEQPISCRPNWFSAL